MKIVDSQFAGAESNWPSACFGSANGWLLLVGASPGDSPPNDTSEWRKLEPRLFVGAKHPGFTFLDGIGYFQHVTELASRA